MAIAGVALLAACTLLGSLLGELLGYVLGVKANVGGVGIAMILLIATRLWIARRGIVDDGVVFGVGFWGALYIPIVVAMAANQNVLAAVRSGPMVALAAIASVLVCFCAVALMGRLSGPTETMDEIEAREAREDVALGDRA